jgi:hypothetical protein
MKMIGFVPSLFKVFSLINCALINRGHIELVLTFILSGINMEILLMLEKILGLSPWYQSMYSSSPKAINILA